MIAAATGLQVVQHDDGSADGMHDLDLFKGQRRIGAIEVTAAADSEPIALWNLMNGRGDRWIEPDLQGAWVITLRPDARANKVRMELPGVLSELEQLGVTRVEGSHGRDHALSVRLADLGVASAEQYDTNFPGSIYITVDLDMERSGGFVEEPTDAVAHWVGEFLRGTELADVRRKLDRSHANERHAFLILPGFARAPFSVSYPLLRDGAPSPTEAPNLPPEITHVWVVSTWSTGSGFRWSPASGWSTFAKLIDDDR